MQAKTGKDKGRFVIRFMSVKHDKRYQERKAYVDVLEGKQRKPMQNAHIETLPLPPPCRQAKEGIKYLEIGFYIFAALNSRKAAEFSENPPSPLPSLLKRRTGRMRAFLGHPGG